MRQKVAAGTVKTADFSIKKQETAVVTLDPS
jgi:hypothetical protein